MAIAIPSGIAITSAIAEQTNVPYSAAPAPKRLNGTAQAVCQMKPIPNLEIAGPAPLAIWYTSSTRTTTVSNPASRHIPFSTRSPVCPELRVGLGIRAPEVRDDTARQRREPRGAVPPREVSKRLRHNNYKLQ